MIRILTDTGSDITHLGAPALGMESVELDIKFNEFEYDYRNDPEFKVFYSNLERAKDLPSTSQVNPSQYLEVFNDAKAKGDEVLVVTLSGGISGTYASAKMAQEECDYPGIVVVDSRNAIIAQRVMAEHAVKMRDEGKDILEIEKVLVDVSQKMCLTACLDTLTYLKKGGRVPPAMAIIGNAIKIKPVIAIIEGKVEAIDKVRGTQAGMRAIWDKLEKDGFDENWPICFGHTNSEERGREFMNETVKKFGIKESKMYPVGGVIGTHTGSGAIVVTYVKKS
ncbi:MAG: DegV family protein [Defluviitaleaceae bacterium]|nr:DegV family protein [Defluviitaleaceae bacterium]